MSAKVQVSSEGFAGEGTASRLTRLLAGLSPSWAGKLGLQFPACCWLEATFSSLPGGPLQYGSLHHQSLEARKATETEVTVFPNLRVEVTSITLAMCYWLGARS